MPLRLLHVACGSLLASALVSASAYGERLSIVRAEDAALPSLDLRPVTAARSSTLTVAEPEAILDAGPPKDLGEGVEGLISAASATTGQKATRVVEEAVWRVLRPWQKAGSLQRVRYWYIGRTIDALLADDGSLEIRDKAGLILTPVSFQTHAGTQPGTSEPNSRAFGSPTGAGIGLGVVDPGRVLNRAASGKPQDNAEARRLLSDTRALREQLMLEHARKEEQLAMQRLSAALERLWSSAGSLAAKQERAFALWDQCAEDATGEQARSQVETFLRERQQVGPCLYDSAQLARLNARRTSRRPFAPCVEPPTPAP